MKRILLLAVAAICLTACSSDDVGYNDAAADSALATQAKSIIAPVAAQINQKCFENIRGRVYVDVTNGLTNPRVKFEPVISDIYSPLGYSYTVQLELQPISDCDNLASVAGSPVIYSISNVMAPWANVPVFTLLPSQLPSGCYKWRIIILATTSRMTRPYCYSPTQWYEAPLF